MLPDHAIFILRCGKHVHLLQPAQVCLHGEQDPVPRIGKFGVVYSRPGQRVLVQKQGDMQVRPTPLDIRLSSTHPCESWSKHATVCLCIKVVIFLHMSNGSFHAERVLCVEAALQRALGSNHISPSLRCYINMSCLHLLQVKCSRIALPIASDKVSSHQLRNSKLGSQS